MRTGNRREDEEEERYDAGSDHHHVVGLMLIQMMGGSHQDIHQQPTSELAEQVRRDSSGGEHLEEARHLVRNLYVQSFERSLRGSSSNESSTSSFSSFSFGSDYSSSFGEDLSTSWGAANLCPNGDLMVDSDFGPFEGGTAGWGRNHTPKIHLHCQGTDPLAGEAL